MGGLIHPEAMKARRHSAKRDFRSASIQIDSALEKEPANPDLTCESAILMVYQAKEEDAFELLPICTRGMRFNELTSLLANHYRARLHLDSQDHDASKRLNLLETFSPMESTNIGTKLTACLIVKDEERVLERCLKSLQGMVDEIVLVDTGSTDRSKEIAARFGAVIGDFAWNDDFAAARNYALALATGNWILWIDADEEMVPESLAAIRSAIVRPQFGGYDIEIINFLDAGSNGDQFRHCPTRLFQNLPGVSFTGRIHEQVNPSLQELGFAWARLDGAVILHHGYRPDIMDQKSKIVRTIALLEREVREDPGNSFQWFNLANAYLVAERFEDSMQAGRFSVELLPAKNGFAVNAYSVLMQALVATKRFKDALTVSEDAKKKGLGCLQISFEACNALLSAGLLDEAMVEAREMLAYAWTEGSSGDIGIFTHKRHVLYAQILCAKGEWDAALEQCDLSMEAAPDYLPAQFVKGQVLELQGRLEEARSMFEKSTRDPACFQPAILGIYRTLASQGKIAEGAALYKQVWEMNVADVDSWLRWKHTVEETGDAKAVLSCFEAFATHHQVTAEFLVDWGRLAVAVSDTPQALKLFAEAMRQDPTCANAYFNCADLLYQMGAYTDAVQIYRAGLSQAPEHSEAMFMLGNALAKAERIEEAKSAFLAVLEKAPEHERASHNLTLLEAA